MIWSDLLNGKYSLTTGRLNRSIFVTIWSHQEEWLIHEGGILGKRYEFVNGTLDKAKRRAEQLVNDGTINENSWITA